MPVHNARKQRGGQIRTRYRQGVRGLVEARGIVLATMNIRSWREGLLEADLRALKQGNVYVIVLKETKLVDGIHTQQGAGYAGWEIEADIRHQGLIAVVWRVYAGW